jgi:NAD(P)-dependent dehydrogenase (short-subunit alcohol dehydrogenase family)
MDLHGKRVLPTGAGSDIGLATARLLHRRGAGIALFGRRATPLEALRRELLGEGVHVMTIYPGATETPMMATNRAGPDLASPASRRRPLPRHSSPAWRAARLKLTRSGGAFHAFA